MRPSTRTIRSRHGWLFLRGLTSCVFFLLAGFSFSVATVRHWDDYRVPGRRLARRFARYLAFWMLGYGAAPPGAVGGRFAAGDAGTMAVVRGRRRPPIGGGDPGEYCRSACVLTRSRGRLAVATLVVAASVALATPIAWTTNWTSALPVIVASYLTGATGSLFPLFPWAAYVFLGASLGLWYADSGASAAPSRAAGRS